MKVFTYPYSLGYFCLVVDDNGETILGIELGDNAAEAAFSAGLTWSKSGEEWSWEEIDPVIVKNVTQCLDTGFNSSVRLKYHSASWIQAKVWDALLHTKPGEVLTYKQLAERIGYPTSVRPVAAACGENRIAILIPCHRVVRQDGKESGYRWGLDLKKKLLEREAKAGNNSI